MTSSQPTNANIGLLLPEIITKADSLQAAPGVVSQVLALTADPDFAMDRMVRLVRLDPALTAHVLKMCNSPYYGLRQKVASLDHAIAVLGVNALVDMVLSSGLLRLFSNKTQDGYLLKKGQLWRHNVACGLITQKLTVGLKLNSSVLFTSALLHDVGKLVLSQFVSQSFYEIESLIEEHDYSLVEAEKEVLGIDHATLGGIIVEKWAFPEDIIRAITYHHHPLSIPDPPKMIVLVALANQLATAVEYGLEVADANAEASISQLAHVLNISIESEEALCAQAAGWLMSARDMFNILM